MALELVRGQNHPLSGPLLDVRVSASGPVVAGVTFGDADGRMREADWLAHSASPRLPGLEVRSDAATGHVFAFELDAVPEDVHRLSLFLALAEQRGDPAGFAGLPAPSAAVTGPDGSAVVTYRAAGLGPESALVLLELYRRAGGWKVRAVGQGYTGGLAELLADQRAPRAAETAAAVTRAAAAPAATAGRPDPGTEAAPAVSAGTAADAGPRDGAGGAAPAAGQGGREGEVRRDRATGEGGAGTGARIDYRHPRRGPASAGQGAADGDGTGGEPYTPVAGDANGWSMEERLYNQIQGMFEDLARTVAAYRAAVEFAESRLDKELETALGDPRTRLGHGADDAREAARARHAELVARAREVLDRDLGQLAAESDVVEPALPPAFARWDNPVWHGCSLPAQPPLAVRLGDLSLPEGVGLRIPMLVPLPLDRGLWIDCSPGDLPESALVDADELRAMAAETATAIAARLAAVHPPGTFTLHVADPAGSAGQALAPLLETGVLPRTPAAGAAGVRETLEALTRRVDLVQMAARGQAADALPPGLGTATQLLVVHGFPHGFDDRTVNQLRYLADEGPPAGVHLLMVADREDAEAFGPVLRPLWRSLLRLTPVAADHLADPWVGHRWTYEPPLVPRGSRVLERVLGDVAARAREVRGAAHGDAGAL